MEKSQLSKRAVDRFMDASDRVTELNIKYLVDGAEGKADFATWLEAARLKSHAKHAFKITQQLNSTTVKKVLDEAR